MAGDFSWLMLSDVCKHCRRAGCLENCPTGAIIRTEFDTVYVQPDICNGCGYCVAGCPFGVIDRDRRTTAAPGSARYATTGSKTTWSRPAPRRAPPIPSFSARWQNCASKAEERVAQLHERGVKEAYLYGADAASQPGTEGLNAFFLLVDKPEVYNLPPDPVAPAKHAGAGWAAMAFASLGILAAAVAAAVTSKR